MMHISVHILLLNWFGNLFQYIFCLRNDIIHVYYFFKKFIAMIIFIKEKEKAKVVLRRKKI